MTDLDAYLDLDIHHDPAEPLAFSVGADVVPRLLLTCIDYRYPNIIRDKMVDRGKYDLMCMAGAGLAPVIDFEPEPRLHWQQTFLEHVEIAIELHDIRKVLVMDHRDCGAYRMCKLLERSDNNTPKELMVHNHQACRLRDLLAAKFPNLEFKALLLGEPSFHGTSVKVPVDPLDCPPRLSGQ